MLRRVQLTTAPGSFTIPRKGRIRLGLVIVIVVVSAIVLRGRMGSSATTVKADTVGSSAAADSETVVTAICHVAVVNPPPRHKKTKPEREPTVKSYSINDVAVLLAHHRPRLTRETDTIALKNGAVALHYSIDTVLQHKGRLLLGRYHPKYGAIALLDPVSGRVLSLVSYVNDGEPYLGNDLYCRSLFPAASVFKVVTASGAIEHGMLNPKSMLKQVGRNHTLYSFQLEKNLSNYREISLEKAFAYSINPVFGRLGIYVLGRQGLQSYAQRFGFSQTIPFELETDPASFELGDSPFEFAELASGFNQSTRISPLFGALMACAVSEGGLIPKPRLVDSIDAINNGYQVYTGATGLWKRAVRAETADDMKQMMMSVARYGTARKSFANIRNTSSFGGIEYGGKTGSVDKDGIGRVDWFVGFARDPHDSSRRIAGAVVTVHGPYWTVHSSYVAAELFRARFRELDRREKAEKERMLSHQTGTPSAAGGRDG